MPFRKHRPSEIVSLVLTMEVKQKLWMVANPEPAQQLSHQPREKEKEEEGEEETKKEKETMKLERERK